ncbi:ABC transporter permease [Paenibacillus glucanolyticus]|uniref:ABC transporter permease n=1 Tax=Paenibacillus glucanolyticus TaxID=59843 RepID=UPI00096C9F5F|nr:ABC transporter permease [Paenibacillus glucanolyticus]OMF76752.1 ABC transporter permease [Paenibacillus glucanolyticus]
MGSNATAALKLGAAVFLTIALITIVVSLFISSTDAVKEGQTQFSSIQTQLSQTRYNIYENTTLSGSQVMNAVRQFNNETQFGVYVQTGKNGVTYYGNTFNQTTGEIDGTAKNTNLQPAQDETNNNYINPSGKFKSSVVRDANNMVRGIVFIQTK